MNVKNKMTVSIAVLVLAILAINGFTYQVRFNQVAVVTSFGRADEGSIVRGDNPDAGMFGNLHLRWPPPFQQIIPYDARVQVLDSRLEEQQTLDNKAVVVSVYVAWRIDDPLQFYRTLRNTKEAEKRVKDHLRDARSVFGTFTFDQLTNTDPTQLKLADAENAILAKLRTSMATGGADGGGYGVKIESIGVRQVVLPESVVEKVFDRMRTTRDKLAERARSEGQSIADTIQARANADRLKILSFAKVRADAIRSEGDAAATAYYKVFDQDEDFAIFLRKLEAYKQIFQHNTTFMIDASEGGLGKEFSSEMLETLPGKKPAN
ncbi:MAG: hypothetical protein GC159_14750 [Phycisphaera sp.]|nr:hypothetical protein [Phycisphaera sp.]